MKSFKAKVSFHREKEDNWGIEEKGMKAGFKNYRNLVYVGYDVEMDVEITETDEGETYTKVLKIGKVDVSDKEIYI